MSGYGSGYYGSGLYGLGEGNTMPSPPTVTGYTGLTQQTQLVLENNQTAPGEVLLMAQTAGAATMSLTTQPNATTASPTTGMELHFFIIGNVTTGSIVITGTDISGNAQVSQTYHIAIAPFNAQGYTEFTTKERWATVGAGGIALTTLTPCQVIVYGSASGKYLLPITVDEEEKIPKFSPQDKRGILFKNFRVTQLTKGVDVSKLDSALYPDSLWAYYMLIGNTPVVTTVPASPASLLAATTKAATMTLTTSLSTVAPGMFLIFAIANSNILAGTIVLSGTDINGLAQSETITVPASNATVYSTKRYASINNSGADKFATTGLTTGATIAVTAVYGWTYTWTYDGINNTTILSACLSIFDGVMGKKIPGLVLSDGIFDWQKEKEITLQCKGMGQDLCIVGDPTPTTYPSGTNPFATLAQPTSLPMVSWPGSFYIDAGSGTAFTTQDGAITQFKATITTGRKWIFTGDGLQRASFVTVDSMPDMAADATIIFQSYQYYVGYFKKNLPLILASTFQGSLLGSYSSSTYYESVKFTLPMIVDSFKVDKSKNPVSGVLKLMSQYDFSNIGAGYKVAVTTQVPPTYTT